MTLRRQVDVGWVVVLLLSLFAIAPLTAPGFFLKAHDATIGVYFLLQFDKSMADGALYPRWAIDWTYGYGYPLFVVIAPLAFYVAEAFHLLGASLVDALKIVYALAFILSGLGMYLFARDLFGRAGGLLAAALYVYAPYHIADVYVRADVAEFAAFAFFPAILWALRRAGLAGRRSAAIHYMVLGALLYGGLILTHITMAMVFTPVAVLYAVFLAADHASQAPQAKTDQPQGGGPSRLRTLALSGGSLALGIAISGAYLFPAFLEQRYLVARDLIGGFFGYANHYVYANQFFSPFWGYGYAAIGPNDQMPYQLGAAAIVLALCVLLVLPRLSAGARRSAAFFLLLAAAFVFAMLSLSQPLWDLARPLVAFIQFPWRLLAFAAFSLALAGGSLATVVHLPGDSMDEGDVDGAARPASVGRGAAAAPLLILVALLASFPYVIPEYTGSDVSLAQMIQFQIDSKELLGDTVWVTERPTGSPMLVAYLAGQAPLRASSDSAGADIAVVHSGGQSYEITLRSAAPVTVLFQIRYFPGWRAYIDGKVTPTTTQPPQGLISVQAPAGKHRILLHFEDTPLRRASEIVTLLGLLTVAGLYVFYARRERRPGA